jgi:MoaA/NifB/PqqE/SkfB family radical SAM enzyme
MFQGGGAMNLGIVPDVSYADNQWQWHNAAEFDAATRDYLQEYLDQVNRYKPIASVNESPLYSLYQTPLATKAGSRSLAQRLARKFKGARVPSTATIAINKACQCLCEHCSAVDYNHSSTQPEMTVEVLKSAIAETVNLGATHIILLGGEPLLRRDLCEIVSSINKDQAMCILFTNGEYLTPKNCQDLKSAGLLGAFVSIDSADPVRHDHFRRRQGLHAKALRGIKVLRDAGLVAGISTHLSASRMAENGFQEMMELGHSVGAHEVTFFDAIPSGKWLREDADLLQPEHRSEILRLVREYRSRQGYPGISAQSTMTSECGSAFCFAANTQFYLSAAGDMCPCDFTPLSFGRYPQNSIHELWEKMIKTYPYDKRAKSCRMQSRLFRETHIFPHLGQGRQAPFLQT